ncbi:MAG: hypothetical protein LBG72_05105 [Spirochaetaceae bacterium]|jgi:hypothetical protein|nr:hypothetical protein [Spirochaetaceae bacterium]
MKKTAVLIAVCCLALPLRVSAADFGIGIKGSTWLAENPYFGPAVLFSVNRVFHFSLGYGVDMTMPLNRRFGFSGDWWIFNPKVSDWGIDRGRLFLFCGTGLFFNYSLIHNDDDIVSGGLRFPLGIDYEVKSMDFFLSAAPSIAIATSEKGDWFVLTLAFGARWWL